ncbi:hypothetical protein C8Q75DRAFT_888670 [Abortiporus biennis]|nr:hypothetical protein C8Q75DRAFT_888670 [Abortiporus biennis]
MNLNSRKFVYTSRRIPLVQASLFLTRTKSALDTTNPPSPSSSTMPATDTTATIENRVTRSSTAASATKPLTRSSVTKPSASTSDISDTNTASSDSDDDIPRKPKPLIKEPTRYISFNRSLEPRLVKRRTQPYVKGRRVAYGYVINWLKMQAKKNLVDDKGRRIRIRWRECDMLGNMEWYVCLLLKAACMTRVRVELIASDGYGPTFGIYWKSTFDPKCVCPPPEFGVFASLSVFRRNL